MGKPHRRDQQSDMPAAPLEVPSGSQDQNAATTDLIKSYASDATAVNLGPPLLHATNKDVDSKRLLGLDDRTFLDRLPHFESEQNEIQLTQVLTSSLAAQSSNDRQISSATTIGMSPFAFEYRPNPVIFPRLATVPENNVVTDGPIEVTESMTAIEARELRLDQATRTKMLDGLDTMEPLTQLLRCNVPSTAPEHTKSPHETSSQQSIFNTGSTRFNSSLQTRDVRNGQDATSSIPPSGQGACSTNSLYKGTAPIISDPEIFDRSLAFEGNSSAVASTNGAETGLECGINSAKGDLSSYLDHAYPIPAYLDPDTLRLSTDSEQTSPTTWHSSPGSISTAPSSHSGHMCAAKSPSPKLEVPVSSISSVSVLYAATPEYPCPVRGCHLIFRTPGQRNNHYNRKHNLRFICTLPACNDAFGLRADLERHKRSVHSKISKAGGGQTFRCTNVGCTTPDKTYNRKDNFTRHVQRCRRAIEMAYKKERLV